MATLLRELEPLADPALMGHEGRAVVFENLEDLAARIDNDELDVGARDLLVLRNIGPKGAPVVEPTAERGCLELCLQTVTQADRSVDFDVLQPGVTVGKTPG